MYIIFCIIYNVNTYFGLFYFRKEKKRTGIDTGNVPACQE